MMKFACSIRDYMVVAASGGLRVAKDKSGVTALEYGLIAALVAGAIIAAFATFRTDLTGLFTDLGNRMTITP
jgi:pilus assembly protein Flp/PilA